MSRETFLAFIVDVLVGAKSSNKRSDIIKIVVEAGERFLGVNQFLPEQLHEYMKGKQNMRTSQLSGLESMEEVFVDSDVGD